METIRKRFALALVAIVPAAAVAQAQPFSADVVTTMVGEKAAEMQQYLKNAKKFLPPGTDTSGATTYRMYVSGMKMRLDMGAGEQKTSMLTDMGPGGKSYMVSHASKTYMEFDRKNARRHGQNVDLARYLRSGGDLCALNSDDGQPVECHKLGAKVIGGRPCQEYEVVPEQGRKQTLCMDAKLHFPLRAESESAVSEMKNVAEGPSRTASSSCPRATPSGNSAR